VRVATQAGINESSMAYGVAKISGVGDSGIKEDGARLQRKCENLMAIANEPEEIAETEKAKSEKHQQRSDSASVMAYQRLANNVSVV